MARRRPSPPARTTARSRRRPPDVAADLPAHTGDLDHDVRIEGVTLTGSWAGESFDGVEVVDARLQNVELTGATLDELLLRNVVVSDCELSGASLPSATFDRVRFERCRLPGLVATDLRATDVELVDCQLTGAWLRGSSFERCELSGCDLREADLYGSRITAGRILHSQLDGSEWGRATIAGLALHGSSLDDLRGVEALRNLVIGGDQLVTLAAPVLATLGIVVDDDFLDDDPATP